MNRQNIEILKGLTPQERRVAHAYNVILDEYEGVAGLYDSHQYTDLDARRLYELPDDVLDALRVFGIVTDAMLDDYRTTEKRIIADIAYLLEQA